MAKIRQFNILHYTKVKKMLFHIAPNEEISLCRTVCGIFSDILQPLLPLRVRKSAESFIAINENNEVKAFITIEAAQGNKHKWYVKRLFLDTNSFNEGKQLIDFVVTKYAALGADTFCVLIDENDETSAGLFSKMCGFRLCSREVMWKMSDFNTTDTSYKKDNFLHFKNSERNTVAIFYNEGILPHFRFSLEKEPNEFFSVTNFGFLKNIFYKLILKSDKDIVAYTEIQITDDNNAIIDLIVTKPNESEYIKILKAIINFIKNRSKNTNIFVLNRNYMICAKIYEDILLQNGFERIQTKMLLVKDFCKPVKEDELVINPALIFKEISGRPAFFSPDSLQKSD